MKPPRVALIGAGQFGSRHLQGLALCDRPLEIYLVDPSEESRRTALERFEEVEGHGQHEIHYIAGIEGLPSELDAAIVATSALYRRSAVEALLAACRVDYLVLEKVLFQSSADCRAMGVLFEQHPTQVWVNAPRRMWRLYEKLKAALEGKNIRQISFSAGGWGMACNAYHMLDLISWLAGSPVESLSTQFLDPEPIPARRAGFYELTGMLAGRLASGVRFTITDHREEKLPLKLMIETADSCFMIQEGKAEIALLDGEDPAIEMLAGIKEEYQSRLTNKLVDSLLDHGSCALPKYAEAASIHEIMLDAFAEVFDRSGLGENGVCPIT